MCLLGVAVLLCSRGAIGVRRVWSLEMGGDLISCGRNRRSVTVQRRSP